MPRIISSRTVVSGVCVFVATIAIAACREKSGVQNAAKEESLQTAPAAAVGGVAGDARRMSAGRGVMRADVVTTSAQAAPPAIMPTVSRPQSSGAPSMVIRNGDVSIQVDSVQSAIEAVRRVAASVG